MTDERDMFDSVAAEYHAVRPAYPDALFADLVSVVGGAGGAGAPGADRCGDRSGPLGRHARAWYLPEGPVPALFDASGLFRPVIHAAYGWSEPTSAQALVRQLGTRSYYNALGAERRDRLLAAVETALDPFGPMPLRHETHLYRAQLKA